MCCVCSVEFVGTVGIDLFCVEFHVSHGKDGWHSSGIVGIVGIYMCFAHVGLDCLELLEFACVLFRTFGLELLKLTDLKNQFNPNPNPIHPNPNPNHTPNVRNPTYATVTKPNN